MSNVRMTKINMKTIITVTTAILITSCAFAETKEELIDKVMSLSNVETDFADATSRTLESIQQVGKSKNMDEMLVLARDYIRKNSLKPLYATALDETYSKEELKLLIKYYNSIPSEYTELLKKNSTDFRVNYALGLYEWRQGLMDEVNSSFRNKPSPDARAKSWHNQTSREKQFYIMGVMDGSHSTCLYFYHYAKDSVGDDELKPIYTNVQNVMAIHSTYLELIAVMDELYNDPKNQNVPFREILRLSEAKLQGKDISASLTKVQKQAEAKKLKVSPNNRAIE